jgi:hypothetical protein
MISASIPPSSNPSRPVNLVYLCVSLIAALLPGCEGMRHEKILTRQEPFRSLIGQRVTLQRSMRIKNSPDGVFNFPAGWVEEGDIPPHDDSAWVVREITRDSLGGNKIKTPAAMPQGRGIPSTLPAGTVIQFESFRLIQDNNVELPGGIPLERFSPMYFVRFSVPELRFPTSTTTENGRTVQTKTLLEYRWGFGRDLWSAPWEPKDKRATRVR